MAKENYIRLRGQLRGKVALLPDKDTGEIVTAMFPLMVVRRNIFDRAGNLAPKWDRPIISTSDKEMIRRIQKFEKHNIIDVKGTFRTQHVKKKCLCPFCNQTTTTIMSMETINPTYVDVVNNQMNNDTDGMNYLIDCAEIANEAKIIGRVCTPTDDIITGETERGDRFTRYQLAVNRKLYIKGSVDEEDHTDFPVVCSYGKVAEDDFEILKQNTLVYIDGYIYTRKYEAEVICENCGEKISFNNQKMHLSPYSVEYLRDYDELLESTHKTATDHEEPEYDHEAVSEEG